MKPKFSLIGTVKTQPTLQKSQSNKDYLAVDIETVWTELVANEHVNVVATYRVVFYEQRAMDFSASIKQGQIVEVDCSLTSTQKPANDGGHFINYSITGIRFERVRSSMAQQQPAQSQQQRQAPPPQQQQQRQAPPAQYQQPRQSPPPNYPTNPQYDTAPQWATEDQGFDSIPF